MPTVRRGLRQRKSTKRLDVALLRDVVLSGRPFSCRLGVISDPDDDGQYYEIVADDSGGVDDVLVEIELIPERTAITARLTSPTAGAGRGIWSIPAIGEEVVVAIPDGRIEFTPAVVGYFSTGSVPGGEQGVATQRTIVVDSEVLVHDGAGGAVPLATKSDVEEVRSKLLAHGHDDPASGVTSKPNSGTVSPPASSPLTVDEIQGTTILKAK